MNKVNTGEVHIDATRDRRGEGLTWQTQAACRGKWRIFDSPASYPQAAHLCLAHCPVLAECRQEIAPHTHEQTAAGIWWGQKGPSTRNRTVPAPSCPRCAETGNEMVDATIQAAKQQARQRRRRRQTNQ